MSPRNYSRQFKRILGISPMKYIQKRWLSYAQNLLGNANLSNAEIARATGYRSTAHFKRAFVRAYTITPAQQRAQFDRSTTD